MSARRVDAGPRRGVPVATALGLLAGLAVGVGLGMGVGVTLGRWWAGEHPGVPQVRVPAPVAAAVLVPSASAGGSGPTIAQPGGASPAHLGGPMASAGPRVVGRAAPPAGTGPTPGPLPAPTSALLTGPTPAPTPAPSSGTIDARAAIDATAAVAQALPPPPDVGRVPLPVHDPVAGSGNAAFRAAVQSRAGKGSP